MCLFINKNNINWYVGFENKITIICRHYSFFFRSVASSWKLSISLAPRRCYKHYGSIPVFYIWFCVFARALPVCQQLRSSRSKACVRSCGASRPVTSYQLSICGTVSSLGLCYAFESICLPAASERSSRTKACVWPFIRSHEIDPAFFAILVRCQTGLDNIQRSIFSVTWHVRINTTSRTAWPIEWSVINERQPQPRKHDFDKKKFLKS